MPRPDGPRPDDDLHRIRELRERRARDATGHYFVEGLRQVFCALDANLPVEVLVYCETLAPAIVQRRVRLARRAGARVVRVSPEQFRGVSVAARASGIGAVLRQHWSSIRDADPAGGLCWIGLGLTRSHGNLGTLLRTAEAVGVAGVVFLDRLTDPFDAQVVRASMGGIFGLRLVRATHSELACWVSRHRGEVVGAAPRGDLSYTEIPLRSPLVVLFGEERRGLTVEELRLCTRTASIPMTGRADSLNLGVAAGVVLFDLRRRARDGAATLRPGG